MKKLFLALVCFASVAFFASCNQTDKTPTVSISTDKSAITSGEEVTITIKANANASTKKDLSSVHFIVSDEAEAIWDTTYTASGLAFEQAITLQLSTDDDATTFEMSAFAYDAANLSANATTTVNVTRAPATPIEEKDFTWNRRGSNAATGLEEFGLEWNGNYAKAIYATITPAAGVTMYEFATSAYTEATTEEAKVAAFENATPIQQWKEFNVTGATSQTFDKVIGTKTTDGKYHLLHITNGTYTSGSYGVDVTITGKAK